ncbi:Vacuolar protein sorting-associated protein 26 [Tritrichomonas foetus]|uniref:Vacuolar protein sorting-associated protein 26 n=1 Tax=Tritrichomonas foetus TaxID=1144522 RepID=A0A1J4KM33_9EUKA|nr:Vacuolar protein sorting-associated protein 26 [Tritrichomonas foetus]|eukprot:OHT10860.1 Vacuolar protein sorting-associated protein 26 [Tritrichomonas foetus]
MYILQKSLDTYLQSRLTVKFNINSSPRFTEYAQKVLETRKSVIAMDENLTGIYSVTLHNKSKTVSHQGLRIAVVGEFRSYENEVYSQFFSRYYDIQPQGEITSDIEAPFDFQNLKPPTATYYGGALQAIYAIQFQIKKLSTFVVFEEQQFYVVGFDIKEQSHVLRDEIGIPNLLHMEILFPHHRYEYDDEMVGKVYFILLKMKIISIQISIVHQEYYEDEKIILRNENILSNFEILDGCPVRGYGIPFRVFLKSCGMKWYLNFSGSKLMSRIIAKIHVQDSTGERYSKILKVNFVRCEPDYLSSPVPNEAGDLDNGI